jgi:hypothetical protein
LDQRKEREEMTLDFLDNTQVDYEEAIVQTKFGKFHYFLLACCGLIYCQTAVGITILSFVLPSATCGTSFNFQQFVSHFNSQISFYNFHISTGADFKMTSADKGQSC